MQDITTTLTFGAGDSARPAAVFKTVRCRAVFAPDQAAHSPKAAGVLLRQRRLCPCAATSAPGPLQVTAHKRLPLTAATARQRPKAACCITSMGFLGFNFDLKDQLAFYGAYHQNRWNQVIHFFFVPAIAWSVLVWLAYSGSLSPVGLIGHLQMHLHFLPDWLASNMVPNLAVVLLMLYWGYYVTLEAFAGVTWGLFIGTPLWVSATWFAAAVPHAWAWALGVFVLSWYMQIHPGHLVLEGRKPALLDSFFQSLVLAPLFVWLELLFALGYRRRLFAELQQRIRQDLAAKESARAPLLDQHQHAAAADRQ